MLKLKAGNIFEKINHMDRKQAYTFGAIGAVILVAILMLFSLLGNGADDSSMDAFTAHGYDLAAMPFINDEAEQLLLSSKYPDMQGNGASLLFSQQEREEREAEDEKDAIADAVGGAVADDEDGDEDGDGDAGNSYASGRSGRGYGGRGGSGGAGGTSVGKLSNASIGRSGGSGVSGTFGAPRGDYTPYKTDKKGEEKEVSFKNDDARRALSQFAQASRAAAGLRDGKLANAKRALQAGNIQGGEAFGDKGIDLSKLNGLALDTNAPLGSNPDLSDLGDKVASEAKNAEKKKDAEKKKEREKGFGEKLLEAMGQAVINAVGNAVESGISEGLNAIKGSIAANIAGNKYDKEFLSSFNRWSGEYQKLYDQAVANGSASASVDALDTVWNTMMGPEEREQFGSWNNLARMFGERDSIAGVSSAQGTSVKSSIGERENTITMGAAKKSDLDTIYGQCSACKAGRNSAAESARTRWQGPVQREYNNYMSGNNNTNNNNNDTNDTTVGSTAYGSCMGSCTSGTTACESKCKGLM